ncbi:MAG: PLP-dependent transferase [Candidatus Obscuribacterales bacterium]
MKPNTKMLWLETPTNPMLQLIDVQALVKAIRTYKNGADIIAVVDNTFASPYLQNRSVWALISSCTVLRNIWAGTVM